ncbi:MAG TPA: PQQ-binding-like beta-propeller repeat protein [Vicinamibacteria bacterium]|nr:PQQ-binding-like beta-propeller repeat protein [Vicinamibacteria bacterium]
MKALAALLVVLPAAIASAQDWPSFRGPRASGVADGHPLPVSWDVSSGRGVRWKTAIPGLALSSPIVWGDTVFVTTAVGSDPSATFRHGLYGDVEPSTDVSRHSWRVLAIDKKSGRVKWEKVAHEGVPKTKRHPKSSQASCTPVTDGRVVVAYFGSEGLHAYDLAGKPLWSRDLGVVDAGWFYDPDYAWGAASSPVIYKDLVIVQVDRQEDSFVAAYRLQDGQPVWRTSRDEIPSWGTPTVYEGPPRDELVTHGTRFIRAYDPLTGKELWRLGPNSEVTTPTPIVAHGLVIITNGYRGIQPIYAVKPGGSGDITLQGEATSGPFIAWSSKRGGPYTPTPVVYGDHLYTLGNSGILAAYHARTGERLYQERVAGKGGAFSASPVAGDGKLYLAGEDGDVFVLSAGPKPELLATNPMGEVLMATPALSEGLLLVRGLKHLFAIEGAPAAAPAAPSS